ncbi:hypothetical protein NE237_023867 [Protea cynaroides]|uniref:Uncharacterized protein n=1 Tax=Protea cynaroides TaxID=273540 RepID=A0A9Q0HCX7_9MAGN|nr:hypothetical protein NE237_023867 [Protea cynaroides]
MMGTLFHRTQHGGKYRLDRLVDEDIDTLYDNYFDPECISSNLCAFPLYSFPMASSQACVLALEAIAPSMKPFDNPRSDLCHDTGAQTLELSPESITPIQVVSEQDLLLKTFELHTGKYPSLPDAIHEPRSLVNDSYDRLSKPTNLEPQNTSKTQKTSEPEPQPSPPLPSAFVNPSWSSHFSNSMQKPNQRCT